MTIGGSLRRIQEYQEQSSEDFESVVTDLLFSNSLLRPEGDEAHEEQGLATSTSPPRRCKQKRKEKQVVMFTDPVTGERKRLLPRMSLW